MSPPSRPSPEEADIALERLRTWWTSSGRTAATAPLPQAFLRDPDKGNPPLSRMIRAGQADVRLGVYLCLVLRATQPPHDVRHNLTSAAWAEMLCLEDPRGRGARRVNSAFKWLVEQKLVSLQPRTGRRPIVQLLDPSGGPGGAYGKGGRWVSVPNDLWLRGWIFELRDTSLAVLLVLLDLLYNSTEPKWVTPERRESYGLSEDTWTRGVRELREQRLLTVRREPLSDDWHDVRLRNLYWIDRRRLGEYYEHPSDSPDGTESPRDDSGATEGIRPTSS